MEAERKKKTNPTKHFLVCIYNKSLSKSCFNSTKRGGPEQGRCCAEPGEHPGFSYLVNKEKLKILESKWQIRNLV